MIKRILRAALGVIFFVAFLLFLLVGAVKFRLLSPTFWKTALDKGGAYQQLQDQVTKIRVDLEGSINKQAGGRTLPPELAKALAPLLSLDKVLTTERFKELVETNLDRVFDYLDGKQNSLVLFLPVKEWDLPVAALGQPALAGFTAQTPAEEVLPLVGMRPEQVKSTMEGVGQVKTFLGYLIGVWIMLLLLVVGIGAGHYFLGVGPIDRISGTAWLLMISGFVAKLIGVGAGNIFEIIAANSKPPMAPWMADLGRSLVGQFFNLGATIGLIAGVAGLGGVITTIVLVKQGKIKEEKEKMSFVKRVLAFSLGVSLGFLILAGIVAGGILATGGSVNFTTGGGSLSVGSPQSGAGAAQSVTEEKQGLAEEFYTSDQGWQIRFPAGWKAGKGSDEKSEGAIKAPTTPTDWAYIEIAARDRNAAIDGGKYVQLFKEAFAAGKLGIEGATLVDAYEEKQEGGDWSRFVFIIDGDGTFSGQTVKQRLYRVEYYPLKSGDGYAITAKIPVEALGKYEAVVKESVDTFMVQ